MLFVFPAGNYNGPAVAVLPRPWAKLLKDLGYVGIEYHLRHARLPRMLEALDKHGLRLKAAYTVPFLEDPVDPGLPGSIKLMRGRATRIEMAIRSRQYKKPSRWQSGGRSSRSSHRQRASNHRLTPVGATC